MTIVLFFNKGSKELTFGICGVNAVNLARKCQAITWVINIMLKVREKFNIFTFY